jgi:peptide/nickel transport system substrate-binding protein
VLARFDDYWGDKSILDKVIFKPIADGPARRQALESGEIQGYDLVDPADLGALEGAGFTLLERPAFNVAYVGFNTAKPPFDNLKIRQAIAHALNREALLTAKYPPGAEVATQFMPPSLFGYSEDVPQYEYDVEKAKALIAESGVAEPDARVLVPDRRQPAVHAGPGRQLPGLLGRPRGRRLHRRPEVRAVEPGLPQRRSTPAAPACACSAGPATSVTRTTSSAPSSAPSSRRGARSRRAIYSDLDAARPSPTRRQRTELYEAVNKKIMEFLPGVPYVHTKPALGVRQGRRGLRAQPGEHRGLLQGLDVELT